MKLIYVTGDNSNKKELNELLRRYCEKWDDTYYYYGNLKLTTSKDNEFDGAIIFNCVAENETIKVNKEYVVAFMMEPGFRFENPWMFKKLSQYGKVISPIHASNNTILDHGHIGWLLPQKREELINKPIPEKLLNISCITSGKVFFEGHRKRLKFARYLQKEVPEIHFFGFDNFPHLSEKTHGLSPYRFSIAIENSKLDYYFTEKINDCFINYTIPLYYGCTNISKYFPKNSYINIDIDNPAKAKQIILDSLATVKWEDRLPLLQEARELVFRKYNFMAKMNSIVKEENSNSERKIITLKPVKYSIYYILLKKIKILILNLFQS